MSNTPVDQILDSLSFPAPGQRQDTNQQPAFNAARGGVDVGDKPVAERGTFGAINDTMIDTANAAAGLVKSGIDLFGPGSEAAKFIDEKIIKDGQSKQSDKKKSYRDTLALDLKEAGVNDGTTSSQLDAEGRKAWIQLKHAFTTDPLGTVGEIGGNLGPFAIIGGGMQAARLAGWVKTGIASVLSSGLSVGEVRGNIWEKVSGMPDAELQTSSPAYAELRRRGVSEAEAKQEVGANFMRNLPELAAVGAIGAVSGKYGVEGMAAGIFPKMGRLGASAVGGFNEGFVQGGSEQLATNVGVQRVKPNQSLLEDLGPNMVAEGLPGVAMGMASGGRGNAHAAPAPDVASPITPPVNPLIDQLAAANGPLSRAAVAANPDLKQAAPVEPPTNPLDQRAVDLSNLLRDGPLLAHLQSTGQTAVASDLLGALAFAKNPQLSSQARQQAVNYLTEQIGQMQAAIMPADQEQDTTLAGAYIADAAIDNIADVAQQPALVQSSPPTPEVVTPFTTPNPELVQIETQNATENIADQAIKTPAPAENITEKSTARTTVQAPKAATPPGTGTAQMRQRKAQLQAMAADGFDTVERQPDGGFSLINPRRNEVLALTGMGDAQLARKAVADYMDNAANQAASSAQNKLAPPTDKQIVAENYKKGHLTINGMDVSIENPRHTTRSGTSPEGKRWSSQMAHHYGYFKKTEGADGDAVDVFIGPRPDGDKVFVIDQNHADGGFDEHKVMMGFANEETARAGYLANYDKGWTGLGAITPMTVPQFKAWVKSKAALKPAAGYDANSNQGEAHDERGSASESGTADAGLQPEPHQSQASDGGARDQSASEVAQAGPGAGAGAEQTAATDAGARDAVERISRQLKAKVVPADPAREDAQALNGLLAIFARLTGKLGYATVGDAVGDGVSNGADFFVNVDRPEMHVAQTIGHEFKHLSERFQGLAKLYDRLWSMISEDGKRAYYENYLHGKEGLLYKDASDKQLYRLKQEMLADFMGKRFNDQPWLAQLAAQKPKLFGDFVRDWLAALSQVIDGLKGLKRHMEGLKNVDNYIAELEQAKAIAAEVAIAWAERHPKLAEQTGVDEILHSRTDPYAEYEFDQDEESFDDFDLDNVDLQAEMEAEQAQTQARQSPPQLEVTDAEIKRAGLMAEEAFPDLAWRHDPDARGMQQTVEVEGLYRPGKLDKVSMNLDRSGLWSVDLRGTWVGPAMNETDGYATEDAVKQFTKRQLAAIDLKERAFDLVSTAPKALQKRLVAGWKSVQAASARKYGSPGRATQSLKDIAIDMGVTEKHNVTITVDRDVQDARNSTQVVTFQNKEAGIFASAILAEHRADGKKFLTANTTEMGKGGLGAAFYQMAAEYAARHNMTLRPEPFLSGINSYRRTEQQIAAALRTGKSNVMVPHPVQRIYGFEDNATRIEQHDANLARLLMAGVRNARELVPGFDELRYSPATGEFTNTTGKPKDAEVKQLLKDIDARAFGVGRGTLARSVLSHMAMLDEIKLNGELVFTEPVLYSERVREDLDATPLRTNIVYEVAPDPNDAAVSQAWNQLTTEQRLTASEAVTHVITPQVLAVLGASGKQVTQIGSYLDDTNTSFALTLDQGDALSVSHALGYVLSQDSMVILSSNPFQGGDATGVVDIHIGDKSAAEIDAIYQRLRTIKVGDEQPIGGQSTTNGIMAVLNFSNINTMELGALIDAKLAGAYHIQGHNIYAAFPQKEDYNYDIQNGNTGGNRSPLWQALNPLRREAASLISHYIDKHSGRDAGDGSVRLAGGRASDSQGAAQQSEIARRGAGQGKSHPAELTPLPGAPNVPGFHGPDPQLVQVARQYARDNGITLHRQSEYVEIDKDRATRIAKAYADMPHAPQDPVVKEAFDNLIKQTTAQYQSLVDAGYKFWFFDLDKPDNLKYISTPWNAMRDIRANKEMGVFSTEDGFGNGDAIRDNPLETTVMDFTWPSGGLNGPQKKVLANDLFRAVHDAFGHGLEGAGFRAQGEENAWQAHIRLFTGSAIGAITSETRGQNSWVNFGPHADINHAAKAEDTVFADQKTGLMPAWTWTEGVAGDADLQHSVRTPMFYSELTRQIEQSSMKQAPAGAWKSYIKALAQKGVKADEIEWSGVNEWLDLQEGKVSRQALTDYLDANGVQVQETVLGQPDEGEIEALLNDEVGEGMSREEAIEYLDMGEGATPTKYSQYQLPGGTNYREVLLTLPSKERGNKLVVRPVGESGKYWEVFNETTQENEGTYDSKQEAQTDADKANGALTNEPVGYTSSHWDQKNVLAHIRINDRTDADGKRVLFVEELQSDWGQEGKKKGFNTPRKGLIEKRGDKYEIHWADGGVASGYATEAAAQRDIEKYADTGKVPTAPFITATDKWLSLALKRIVKMAVDGGYDKVAFVNGEQSAERYDLSKQIDSIEYKVSGDQNYKLVVTDKNGNLLSIPPTLSPDGLEQYVGKEMAQKIVDTAKPQAQWIEGVDLSVGGEGMKAFYDKIVPNTTKEVIRKLGGGRMDDVVLPGAGITKKGNGYIVDLGNGDTRPFGNLQHAEEYRDKFGAKAMQQPSFALTDAMRQKAAAGLPLFSKRSMDDLEAEQDHQDAAPKAPKTRPYAGKKVDIPVKIEDTGEVATLIMDVNLTLDDFDKRQENMRELLGCLK